MKKSFIRTLSVICTVLLLASTIAVWAEASTPATTTDLAPVETEVTPEEPGETPPEAEEPGEEPEIPEEEQPEEKPEEHPEEQPEEKPAEKPEEKPAEKPEETPEEPETPKEQTEKKPEKKQEEAQEEAVESEEIVITKAVKVGDSWSGRVSKKKPAILKLDVSQKQTVHILVEGKGVWVSAEKSDRRSENSARTETDSETNRTIISLKAETGSYLITLGPVETNLMSNVKVSFLNNAAYEAWKAEQEENETEPEGEPEEEQPAEEPEGEPEDEQPKEETEGEPEEEQPEEEPEGEPEEEQPGEEPEGEPEGEPEEEQPGEEPEGEPEEEQPGEEPEGEPEEEQPEEEPEGEPEDEQLGEEPEGEPEEELPGEEPEGEPEEELEGEPEEESEENRPESEMAPERHITVDVTWDVPDPIIGDTAHLTATLEGYEGLQYSMQWQYSPDRITWYDIEGETDTTMDVVVTEENNVVYWRILVYVEEDQED